MKFSKGQVVPRREPSGLSFSKGRVVPCRVAGGLGGRAAAERRAFPEATPAFRRASTAAGVMRLGRLASRVM